MRRAIHIGERKLEAVIEDKLSDNKYQVSIYELKKNKRVLEVQGKDENEALNNLEDILNKETV